ncbi:DinB family protein [bacterium]|nr:DinB family protein [bacterium]
MYHTLEEFLQDWREERAKTERILGALTTSSLEVRVYPEGRTLGFLAWHIVTSLSQMMAHVGLQPTGVDQEDPQPTAASDILAGYQQLCDSFDHQLRTSWTDASLQEECEMFGQMWKIVFALQVLLRHEIHHRAQCTAYMRHAGLTVPGIYGPAREEWSAMGREEQP